MPTVGFQSFLLRLLSASTLEKSRKYDVYSRQTENGYDYYQSFRRACQAMFEKGAAYSDVFGNILRLKKSNEREDNSTRFDAAVAFIRSLNGTQFPPPRGYLLSPQKKARVKLAPDAAMEVDGQRRIYSFWTIKDIKLSRRGAGVGIYMLQSGLKKANYADCKFVIVDLVRKRQFDEQVIPNDAGRILNAELALLDSLFSD
jgi:hypothetical protein